MKERDNSLIKQLEISLKMEVTKMWLKLGSARVL